MKNYRNRVVENHYSTTKEVMVAAYLFRWLLIKKFFMAVLHPNFRFTSTTYKLKTLNNKRKRE